MNRHRTEKVASIVIRLVVSIVAVLLLGKSGTGRTEAKKPNVILIVTDDQGYADVGFQGCKDIRTPHLDALATAGVICTEGYVTFPVCSPSRAAIMSGRHGARYAYDTNPDQKTANPHARGLPLSERTMGEAMKEAGYVTGLIGKWHLGVEPHHHPNHRGFDEFFGFLGGGHRYLDWKPGKGYSAPILRNSKPVKDANKQYLTDLFSNEAVEFVERHSDKPFFLYLAYNAPHTPLEAPRQYLDRYSRLKGIRRTYAAMVSAVDDGVGRLRTKLSKLGLEGNTLIFFLSDNGGPERANASNNGLLRGGKSEMWEGGIRVPFVVSWPEKLKAGGRFDKPVSSLDILPTALTAAGITIDEMPAMEGVDLLPCLTGMSNTTPHDHLYWRHRNGSWAVRDGEWKLVRDPEGKQHLFRMSNDEGEKRDLLEAQPETATRLRRIWQQWNSSNGSRIPWFPQGPYSNELPKR